MSSFRAVTALVWMVAATVVGASGTEAVGEHPERSPKALLSLPSAGGGAVAVRTEPSPAPARDAEGLPPLAIPVAPRSTGVPRTAESSLGIVVRLATLPHPQRGPPLPA